MVAPEQAKSAKEETKKLERQNAEEEPSMPWAIRQVEEGTRRRDEKCNELRLATMCEICRSAFEEKPYLI